MSDLFALTRMWALAFALTACSGGASREGGDPSTQPVLGESPEETPAQAAPTEDPCPYDIQQFLPAAFGCDGLDAECMARGDVRSSVWVNMSGAFHLPVPLERTNEIPLPWVRLAYEAVIGDFRGEVTSVVAPGGENAVREGYLSNAGIILFRDDGVNLPTVLGQSEFPYGECSWHVRFDLAWRDMDHPQCAGRFQLDDAVVQWAEVPSWCEPPPPPPDPWEHVDDSGG